MNDNNDRCRENRDTVDIGVWENEGGALDRSNMNHHYGRRIEADRSWSVYHVFTGVPANAGGHPMTGLSRLEATSNMMSLNLRNEGRRKDEADGA